MKLSDVILQKMVGQIRSSNDYAVELDELVKESNVAQGDTAEDLASYCEDQVDHQVGLL
jgi:hypothetical protein